MLANVLAVSAQFERRLIGQRTKDALAAKREAGTRLGRPPTLPSEVREQIRTRDEGSSYRAIAGALNDESAPTAHNRPLVQPLANGGRRRITPGLLGQAGARVRSRRRGTEVALQMKLAMPRANGLQAGKYMQHLRPEVLGKLYP
jgi:hypothetical protein